MAEIRSVGFSGLGIMGSGMARNLARKGSQVTAWNRTRSRAEALASDGIRMGDSPAAVAAQVDAFCTCVADPPALRQVVFGAKGLIETAKAGQLFIDFSTVSPDFSRELEQAAAARGIDFVECPVTGSKDGAAEGTLGLVVVAAAAGFR